MSHSPQPRRRDFTYRLAEWIVRFRYPLWVVVIAITAVTGYYAMKLSFSHEVDIWFLEKDTAVDNYSWYKTIFPSDEFVIVAFRAKENPFGVKDFKLVRSLSEQLEKLTIRRNPPVWNEIVEGIHQALTGDRRGKFFPIQEVISFTNVKHAVNRWSWDSDDAGDMGAQRFWVDEPDESEKWVQEFKVDKFVVRGARTPEEANYLLKKALANDRFRNALIGEKGDFVAVIGVLHKEVKSFWLKQQLSQEVWSLVEQTERDHKQKLFASGMFLFGVEFQRLNQKDQFLLLPAIMIAVMITLMVIFRTPSGVILPLVVPLMALGWIRGMMAMMGLDDNILGGMLPPLMIAVGIADSVHYYSEYRHFLPKLGKREAVIASVAQVLRPCFFTSLTTAVGFASLMTSSLQPMAQVGMMAALGVTFAFMLSTMALPLALDFMRESPPEFIERWLKRFRFGKVRPKDNLTGFSLLMDRLTAWTQRYPRAILTVAAICVAISCVGIYHVNPETNDLEMMRTDNPKRQALDTIAANMAGVAPIELIFDTHRKQGVKDPAFLQRLDTFQKFVHAQKEVRQVTSVVDFIKEFRGVFMGGDAADYRVPKSRRVVGQLLGQMEGDQQTLGSYTDFNYRYARLTAKTGVMGSAAVEALMDRLHHKLKTLGFDHRTARFVDHVKEKPEADKSPVAYTLTGMLSLFVRMETYLLNSLIRSFSIALVVICLLMMIQLRSWKLGLLSMIPNLFPIFIYLGVMGAAGINLDIGTAMIAAVAIGLCVDDTIHFMERHARKFREGKDYSTATHETLREAGLPIFITSVILFMGFMTFVFGSFVPTIHFGVLTSITIVAALFGDLVILPVLIEVLKPYGECVSAKRRDTVAKADDTTPTTTP